MNNNYAILRVSKLSNRSEITSSAGHTYRERETLNSNPKSIKKNQHIFSTSSSELMGKLESILATQAKVRKNAVLTLEYLITASPAAFGEMSDRNYFNDSLKFLIEKHGRENVVGASIHRDETTPHMVVYVVPIDKKGKLNARSFLGGRDLLEQLQTDFAASVGEKHGLARGIKNSSATHIKIKDFYKKINTPAIDVPEVKEPSKLEAIAGMVGIDTEYAISQKAANVKVSERLSQLEAKEKAFELQKKGQEALKRDLSDSREKLKLAASRLREMPLSVVLERMGAIQDSKDKNNYKTEVGRITVTGQKFFAHDLATGGGGAIDLIMMLRQCDYKSAVATLSAEFGQSDAAAAIAFTAVTIVEEAKTARPVRSVLPDDVPGRFERVKAWLTKTRGIPASIVDSFRKSGILRVDERGNAIFLNVSGSGGEIRGEGRDFKGYRGERGIMVFNRSEEKSAIIVESGTDAMAYCKKNRFGKIVSVGGDFGQKTIDQLKELQHRGYRLVIGTDSDESGVKKANKLRLSLGLGHADREMPKGRDWQDEMRQVQPIPEPSKSNGASLDRPKI